MPKINRRTHEDGEELGIDMKEKSCAIQTPSLTMCERQDQKCIEHEPHAHGHKLIQTWDVTIEAYVVRNHVVRRFDVINRLYSQKVL